MAKPPAPVKKLARSREDQGDRWVHRFENGLVVHTDPFLKPDRARILPLGGPQDAIVSRLAARPEIVSSKIVFEPFAGSGILGLMALRLGAAHVDFLDVNPRAQQFQIENARRNGFAPERYRALLASIAEFAPEQPYDLILANPPFVPTPPAIAGTLTSNGGADGGDLVDVLLARLGLLLRPEGEAYACVMQIVADGRPLIASAIERHVRERHVELSQAQAEAAPLDYYVEAYQRCFPGHAAEIAGWVQALQDAHGAALAVQHYVAHVSPCRPGPTTWSVTQDLYEKYGQIPYPSGSLRDLALARAMENVVPEA